MTRGDIVLRIPGASGFYKQELVKILGPEDFDGYEYNRLDGFELVETIDDGRRFWVTRKSLKQPDEDTRNTH